MVRPTFTICGQFSGTTDSASKWLKKFDLEMEDYRDEDGRFPPTKYLGTLDALLTGEASDWSESHPEAIRLLHEAETAPTPTTVENFRALFCERFPSKVMEISPVPFDVELAELHQRPEESLAAYYKRVQNLMQRVGARDRPAPTPAVNALTSLEAAMLDTILRAFIKGLNDHEIRKEATRGLAATDRSLRMVYSLAEEARRTNAEIQKLFDEESKSDELLFYKNLVQKNIPKQQVASLLASHQASKAQASQASTSSHQPWSISVDPPQQLPQTSAGHQHENHHQYENHRQHENHRPSYGSGNTPVLAHNPSKANVGRGGNSNSYPSSRRNFQPTPKELPDRTTSKNPYINGTLVWSFAKDGTLCVRCGELGCMAKNCKNSPLPAWEQSYLRMSVFGDNPHANFASVGFGHFDGATKPYGTDSPATLAPDPDSSWKPSAASSSASTLGPATPSSSIDSYILPYSSSLEVGIAGLNFSQLEPEVKAVEVQLGEGSAPNKRARVEDEDTSPPPPLPKQPQLPQPQLPQPQLPQGPPINMSQGPSLPQPTQAVPAIMNPPAVPYQVPAAPGRPKQKGQKRVGKKAEPQPLVGMFNDLLGKYDSPVSIRYVLQNNKVDMSWMDLMAWSPAACKELKRMCTRVPKKRMPKASAAPLVPLQSVPQSFPQFQSQAFPQFQPQFATQPQFPIGMDQVPSQASTQQTLGHSQGVIPEHSQVTLAASFYVSASSAEESKQTLFLRSLIGIDKAFRVPAVVRKPDGSEVGIDRNQTQSDQGSEMNVISQGMVRWLGLDLRPLAELGFKGLSMRTADHRDTVLEYWVWLLIAVEGVWRNIRCFVAPEVVSVTESGKSEHLSLILGIPWLYSVDALISIRQSTIFIGDASIGEQVRRVVGPELVFCKDHNLLMYPKAAMAKALPADLPKQRVEELDDSSSESSDSDSGDDLSEVEDPQGF